MPVPVIAAGIGAAGGIISGLASKSGSSSQTLNLAPPSAIQSALQGELLDQYNGLNGFMNPGNGALSGADAQNAYGASVSGFSQALGNYAANGGMPTAAQTAQANGAAANIFAPQRAQLAQDFYNMDQQGMRQQALLGRGPVDPIIQAKLATQKGFMSQQLASQQTATGQQLALQIPQQQLSALGQQNQLLGNVYQQALANRQYIMSQGSQLLGQQYNYQLGAAGRTSQTTIPGSVGGAMGGAFAGAGAGLDAYSRFGFQYKPASGMTAAGFAPFSPQAAGGPGPWASPY